MKKRWAGYVACMGEMRNAYKILVGKYDGKRQLGRRWHRWEDSIRMGPREIAWEGVDWIHLAQNRCQWQDLFNTVMNFGSHKGKTFLDYLSAY